MYRFLFNSYKKEHKNQQTKIYIISLGLLGFAQNTRK